uniref:Uncharacterized protein n=1 Tax=Spumella elongata TaxID=89044 RepID=A0A7S3HIB7_9STRA|mmetsp:Transcript_54603/g.95464  ORF Transcript_54603/g.95464 Transcript_54603/m.95464 type:complete len:258 (+) Transcript_54603:193-966(+)
MKFWGVKRIPYASLEYCYKNDYSVWKEELVRNEMVELHVLTTALKNPKLLSLEAAISTNRAEFVECWLGKNEAEGVHGMKAITQGCRYGMIDQTSCKHFENEGLFGIATLSAPLPNTATLTYCSICMRTDVLVKENPFVYAARGGQLECMKYLHSVGCRWDKNLTMEYAVPTHHDTTTRDAQLFGGDQSWTDDFTSSPLLMPVLSACAMPLRMAAKFETTRAVECPDMAWWSVFNCCTSTALSGVACPPLLPLSLAI